MRGTLNGPRSNIPGVSFSQEPVFWAWFPVS